jgi:hypothetical protein
MKSWHEAGDIATDTRYLRWVKWLFERRFLTLTIAVRLDRLLRRR